MDVVRCTLDGIAARSTDEGAKGLGRHAKTIRLGKSLWQSPSLTPEEKNDIHERFFDDCSFPPLKESKKALEEVRKLDQQRPAPYEGRTTPSVTYSIKDYGGFLDNWLRNVQNEKEKPTTEQLDILKKVKERILCEVQLEKEGNEVKRPDWKSAEEPLRGFIHGPPGTGTGLSLNGVFLLSAIVWFCATIFWLKRCVKQNLNKTTTRVHSGCVRSIAPFSLKAR